MSFDDLYNKLRSLELDVRIGHSYGVKAAAAPTHSAFYRSCQLLVLVVSDALLSLLDGFLLRTGQKEKKEWEVKFEATLARFEKWKESSKNLEKLINSSMSTRTKIGLGFKEYFRKDEVFDLSTPSIFYPEPVEDDKPSLLMVVKAGGDAYSSIPPSLNLICHTPYKSTRETHLQTQRPMHPVIQASRPRPKTLPAVDIKTLPESMLKTQTQSAGSSQIPCLENVELIPLASKETDQQSIRWVILVHIDNIGQWVGFVKLGGGMVRIDERHHKDIKLDLKCLLYTDSLCLQKTSNYYDEVQYAKETLDNPPYGTEVILLCNPSGRFLLLLVKKPAGPGQSSVSTIYFCWTSVLYKSMILHVLLGTILRAQMKTIHDILSHLMCARNQLSSGIHILHSYHLRILIGLLLCKKEATVHQPARKKLVLTSWKTCHKEKIGFEEQEGCPEGIVSKGNKQVWLHREHKTREGPLNMMRKIEEEVMSLSLKALKILDFPEACLQSGKAYLYMESVRSATTPYEAAKTKLKDESDPPVNCKKQTIVATSSTEAEYVAAASCCAQVLWIQNQLLDYGFNFMNTKIFIDNQSTICIVKKLVSAGRSMILLVVILSAGCFVSAGCVFLLSAWFLLLVDSFCWLNTFLLLALFMLSIHLFMLLNCFCCAQFDIAGWLVSATSQFVFAGSLQSCWCHNVSAA
ncbi:hypothetical protein Tco_0059071 [Tanacetum coccineum]